MIKFEEKYNKYKKKVQSKESFDIYENEEIRNIVDVIDKQIDELNKNKMLFTQLINYNDLKEKGFSNEEIKKFYREDDKFVEYVTKFVNEYLENRNRMFGYPANMTNRSGITEYLRFLEFKMYLINNCGDPNEMGNYKMDSKKIELMIIDMIKENLKLCKSKYFGYITSGGTEGNFWGMREGFSKFKNGVLYYSEEAHYSVEKFVKFDNVSKFDNCKISSISNGKIDTEKLIKEIRKNWYSKNKPAIIILTWGTTKIGEKDDIEIIQDTLKKEKIPYYMHIDAALYGGIPNNQENAPIISDLNIDFDSIAISLHKYIGSSKVNGVIIAKKKTNHKYIDYIGQEDTTYLGSRDSLNFSVYQQIKELFYRSKNSEYMENIEYIENLFKKMNITYNKCKDGNIFVLNKVSDKLCKKYQLSSFENNGKSYIHIIVFPYQKKENIEKLVKEISNEYNKIKQK